MGVEIRHIHPLFAAEVSGVDLGAPGDAAAVGAIWEAIDRYAVLVFRDQHLDDEKLRDFAANFGTLEIGRAAAEARKRRLALPEIGDISNLDEGADCVSARIAGGSTASATGFGIRMLLTCPSRSCSECFLPSRCRQPVRSAVARPNSLICAPPMMPCRSR
jgi:hypothetical protein